jgi:hypothetical protein
MQTTTQQPAPPEPSASYRERTRAYDEWIAAQRIPIHTGYFVDDIRTVELGWWEARQCNGAFLQLAGQEGVSDVHVTEIPAGQSAAPVCMSMDEIVYVADGRGLTTISTPGGPSRTFEWQKHSLFMLPRHRQAQMSSTQGDRPARLLHYSRLPLVMSIIPDPEYLFGPHAADPSWLAEQDSADYSEAKFIQGEDGDVRGTYWMGNFFPDMRVWDNLVPLKARGAGGHTVRIQYPSSPMWNHMSVFPSKTYKKAHRHGPGTLIVIPTGDGYSYMWPEGHDKVFIPWHEASVFVPPNKWFHQHFNVGANPARYLAFHGPRGPVDNERVEDPSRDQIEYPQEDPLIRQTFESELAKRGLTSLMPEEAYQDPGYKWDYGDDD